MIPTMAAQRYKTVQVQTCSPGDLLVLLYQGLHRFLTEAATAMRAGERGRAGERIDKAYGILCELLTGLRREEAPELCDRLQGLYVFCMGHLVEANIQQDAAKIDEVAKILTPVREAFTQAVRMTESKPPSP